MYNNKLVYKIIWVFFGVILWKEKEALTDIERVNIHSDYEYLFLWHSGQ